jgi:hypothetical protein
MEEGAGDGETCSLSGNALSRASLAFSLRVSEADGYNAAVPIFPVMDERHEYHAAADRGLYSCQSR